MRERLPDRRPAETEMIAWHSPGGQDFKFFACVGFRVAGGQFIPQEIFLKPKGELGKQDNAISVYAEDVGYLLSLLLQHGYTPGALAAKLKPGTLARRCAEHLAARVSEAA